MKLRNRFVFIGFAIMAGAPLVYWFFLAPLAPHKDQENRGETQDEGPGSSKSVTLLAQPESALNGMRPGVLSKWERKWYEFERIYSIESPEWYKERDALVARTVESLGCSVEMIALLEFLNERRIPVSLSLGNALREKFLGEESKKYREMLVALPVGEAEYPRELYRQNWSYDAGMGCPPEEFEKFCEELGDEKDVQNAIYGRSLFLADSDPLAAIDLVLSTVGKGVSSTRKGQSLSDVIAKLPEDSNFREIENSFPFDELDHDGSMIYGGRSELFRKWEEVDPMQAGDYIASNPDRVNPSIMGDFSRSYSGKHPEEAFLWIQELPDGPHFDNAVLGVVGDGDIATNWPEEAMELSKQVVDPKIREKCFWEIKHFLTGLIEFSNKPSLEKEKLANLVKEMDSFSD